MQIGIIGAGHVGCALAIRLVELGHLVKVANSRGRDSLQNFAKATGAAAVDAEDVSSGVDVLIIAIPYGRIAEVPKLIVTSLPPTAIVVDTGNYYPLRTV